MSFQDQLLNLYLLNIQQTLDEYKISHSEEDPTLYNSLFQLHKYYASVGNVPIKHRKYLYPVFQFLLDDTYNDYFSEHEDEGGVSFDEYLKEWGQMDFEDSSAGDGAHNIYILTFNVLKKIYRLMK